MVENLPANAGDTGSSPGLGRSHMPRSNWAREPQLLSLRVWSLCSVTREAAIVRGLRTAMKSGPRLQELEKALAQKWRPNTPKKINQSINKFIKKKKKIYVGFTWRIEGKAEKPDIRKDQNQSLQSRTRVEFIHATIKLLCALCHQGKIHNPGSKGNSLGKMRNIRCLTKAPPLPPDPMTRLLLSASSPPCTVPRDQILPECGRSEPVLSPALMPECPLPHPLFACNTGVSETQPFQTDKEEAPLLFLICLCLFLVWSISYVIRSVSTSLTI